MVVVINLQMLHSSYLSWQLGRSGVEVAAAVTDTGVLSPDDDPSYVVQFRFDDELDPEQRSWSAQVDQATYDEAVETELVGVRVLPDNPSAYEVTGQVGSRLGLVITLFADVVLVGLVMLLWRYRGPGNEELRLVATEDVTRAKPGSGIDRLGADGYAVVGEVVAIDDDGLVLDLGDRQVRVDLAGHANPVGYQQPARVIGRMVE